MGGRDARPTISNAPDAAPFAVAARVVQRNFVMSDDTVVEIRHINRAVGAELNIHRAKPGIITGEKVRLLLRLGAGAVINERIPINAAGHHVADKNIVAKLRRKIRRRVINNSRDGRRAVLVVHHRRRKAQAVVRLAKTRVIAAAQ